MPVKSTGYGLKNLERVANMLMTATTGPKEAGKPYDDMSELYARMWGQWTLEMNHVTAIVGGFDSQQKNIGQDGVRFTAVPKARQASGGEIPGRQSVPDSDLGVEAGNPAAH